MKYKFAVIGWSLLIFGLSLMPGRSIPKVGWNLLIPLDKLAHFSVYGILAILLLLQLAKVRPPIRIKDLITIILICSIYGVVMEAMQYYFLSDRFFEIPDIIANIIGSIAGSFFVYLFLKR